jgi:uncharacterized membrane protein YccF (DUF307 family)
MTTLANILWFVLGGFLISLGYLLGGVLLALTLVGIPLAVPCFKLAGWLHLVSCCVTRRRARPKSILTTRRHLNFLPMKRMKIKSPTASR